LQIIPHFSALKKCPREIDRYQFCQRMQLRLKGANFVAVQSTQTQKKYYFSDFRRIWFLLHFHYTCWGWGKVDPKKNNETFKNNNWNKYKIMMCPTKCPTKCPLNVQLSVYQSSLHSIVHFICPLHFQLDFSLDHKHISIYLNSHTIRSTTTLTFV